MKLSYLIYTYIVFSDEFSYCTADFKREDLACTLYFTADFNHEDLACALYFTADFKREDLACALLNTLVVNLVVYMHRACSEYGIKQVLGCGGFFQDRLVRRLTTTEWTTLNYRVNVMMTPPFDKVH